jgi:ABC-2 type transport system ATP-binding protein
MRQRLGIADALVKDPRVLILDEPTIAIDPQGVAEILDLIRRLVHERGLALLLSSHLLEQVQNICDRVGIFVKGRLVAQGPVDELAQRLGHGTLAVEIGLEGVDGTPVDRDRAAEILRGVAGVTAVIEDRASLDRWRVDADRDVRGDLVTAVTAAGLRLNHLRRADTGLDAVYRRAVAGELTDDRVH